MTRIRNLLACVAVAALTAPHLTAQTVVLAANGQPRISIVVPADPDPTERLAARELQRYLTEIIGAEVPAPDTAAVPGNLPLHVGGTARGLQVVDQAGLHDADAFVIAVTPASIAIAGRTPRGALYGVYRFLEDHCGCAWLAPGIEDVPRSPSLTVSVGHRVFEPDFNMRLFNARRDNLMDWGLKTGMNGYYTAATQERHGNAYYMPDALPGCHTYYRVIPADPHAESHPEWMPLIDGQRVPTQLHGRQLCVTAEGLADAFARHICALFDTDPQCRLTSISPNDGRGWCECETCQALDQRLCGGRMTKQGLAGEQPFRGDRVFWFANEVAERVAKRHPDRHLLVLAYINYAEPPDTVVPLPNVVPYLCHYAPADYSRAINDASSEPNAQFNTILTAWAARAPHLLFYSYVSKSMWWRLPRPIVRTFAADIKYLHSLGIRRYYCQSTLSDWALDGPLYYVLAKLMWDIDADPDALAREWTQRMFGPAAADMLRFRASVEAAVLTDVHPYSDNPPRDVPGLFDAHHLDRAERALAQAVDRAGDSQPFADRVAEVNTVFRYGRLVIRGLEAEHRFHTDNDLDAGVEARQSLEEALAIYNARDVRQHLERLRFAQIMGTVCTGFGESEEKGGQTCWNTDETGLGDGHSGWAVLHVNVPRPNAGFRLFLDVWGASDLNSIVVNTGGLGRSYVQGGIWNPVRPDPPLDGQDRWNRCAFTITPDLLPEGHDTVRIGMGGADSQIWISKVSVEALE